MCLVPGGFSLVRGGVPGPGGVLLGLGVLLGPGGVLLGPGGLGCVCVCLVPGGSPWSGGVLLGLGGGVPGPRGVSGDPPPVNRITDTCKNITLATTSLRPVMSS